MFPCALFLAGLNGCASSAREISSAATPVVVHQGLHEANTPDNQAQLAHLLDTPAMKQVGQNIGEGVGIGLFNQANQLTGGGAVATAATDANSPIPTTNTSQPATNAADNATSQPGAPGAKTPGAKTPAAKTPGAAAVMGLAGGGGGLNGFVHSSVQEAFLAATDPQFKAGERAMSESVGEGFVSGMITVLNKEGPALADTIRKQLGPIFQDLIREQIAPAIHDMLQQQLAPLALQVWKEGAVETLKLTVRPDLQPDVMQNAENASVGASRGTHKAMIESGFLSPSGDFSPHIKFYLWTIMIGVGMIFLAIFCLLIMLNLLVLHHWRRRHSVGSAA